MPDYDDGYFEGVRSVFLIYHSCLVRYEDDGVIELQLDSEKFISELGRELKAAKKLRDNNE